MKSSGQIAFEAYNASRGGVTHDGRPTPPWEELGDGVREGWEAAARAVEATTPGGAPFRSWAILELMGHRRMAGLVSDVELFGSRMVRIDIPSAPPVTQYYGGASIYCLTPTDEETCRRTVERAASYSLQLGPGDDADDGSGW